MIIHLVRVVFVLAVAAITLSFALQQDVYEQGAGFVTKYILLPVAVAFALVMVDMLWRGKRLAALSGLFFGLLAGLVVAFVLGLLVDITADIYGPSEVADPGPSPSRLADEPTETFLARQQDHDVKVVKHRNWQTFDRTVELTKLLVGAAAVFMCVSFVRQTRDSFRFIVPYVEFSREMRGARPLLLDTSVIIDGRISDIAETRIIESNVIVPRFVLDELQTVADSADKLKRNRGRRGLDILNRLRASDKISLQIMDVRAEDLEGQTAVDGQLVALAKRLNGRVVTNDYNLNKIAELRGVDVININDLANALKPVMLPGESMSVKVIRPGEEAGQGVGYLEDGTMIVVEGGRDYIDRDVQITVTSVLQTSAGRMIFGRAEAKPRGANGQSAGASGGQAAAASEPSQQTDENA